MESFSWKKFLYYKLNRFEVSLGVTWYLSVLTKDTSYFTLELTTSVLLPTGQGTIIQSSSRFSGTSTIHSDNISCNMLELTSFQAFIKDWPVKGMPAIKIFFKTLRALHLILVFRARFLGCWNLGVHLLLSICIGCILIFSCIQLSTCQVPHMSQEVISVPATFTL